MPPKKRLKTRNPAAFGADEALSSGRRRANYKYDSLHPTLEEIVDTYTELYGKESRESDIESDESSAAEEVEEDEEED